MDKHIGQKKEKTSKTLVAELYFWAQALVFALVFLVLLNVFFFRVSGVSGSSMVPTLEDRQQLILRVIGYDTPQRGDVIVITAPHYTEDPLVKRVIAVGGDTVDIDPATGNVSINGEVQYEPYISERIRDFGNQQYPLYIPEGCVFVMGDNRNASTDSRETAIGILPQENIIGKVIFRFWPITKVGVVR